MATIVIQAEGEEQQKFALEAATITLGRGLESDIRLKDIKSSRRHCQIVKDPQGFEVVDLSSGNGTFVNGVQIKQHRLASGDKIQIGNTTVTFIDGEAAKSATSRLPAAGQTKGGAAPSSTSRQAPVPPTARTASVKKSTGPIPAAAKPAGESSKAPGSGTRTGVPKPATSHLPTAPTKKITSSIPTRKPATQPVPAVKPPTQSLERPSTTSLKKGATQRTGHTTRSTGHVSATQRFHTEARRKKINPVAIIIGIIVVAFGAVLSYILFFGEDDTKYIRPQYDKYIADALKAYQENKFDEALAFYEKALKLVEPYEAFKRHAAEIRKTIIDVKNDKESMGAADKEFLAFKKRFEDNAAPARVLWDEGKQLQKRSERANVSWAKELQEILERLNKMIDTEKATERRQDFQVRRDEINTDCKLGDKTGKANFSLAVKKWKEYIDGNPGDDNRNKAKNEILSMGFKINDDMRNLRNRAERLVGDRKKDEAVDMLKSNRPRFEKTEGEDMLEKLIKDIEKMP